MNKEVNVVHDVDVVEVKQTVPVTQEAPAEPTIQELIAAAVKEALAGLVPVAPSPAVGNPPQVNMGFSSQPSYKKVSKGFPVQPGQTWLDLSDAQRKQWFAEHESRWKQRFGIQNKGVQANMNWTRG